MKKWKSDFSFSFLLISFLQKNYQYKKSNVSKMRNEPNRKNRINKVEEGSFVDRKIVTFSYLPVSKVELFQETKY